MLNAVKNVYRHKSTSLLTKIASVTLEMLKTYSSGETPTKNVKTGVE